LRMEAWWIMSTVRSRASDDYMVASAHRVNGDRADIPFDNYCSYRGALLMNGVDWSSWLTNTA
jgi:hypothetical protein